MNKYIFPLLLCLFPLTAFAQNDLALAEKTETDKSGYANDNLKKDMAVVFGEKSIERKISEKKLTAWSTKLDEFLLASDDDFAHAMTLAKLVSGLDTAKFQAKLHNKEDEVDVLNDLSYQPFGDLLNQMIAQSKISTEAFDILNKICFEERISDFCHANVLLEKRMQQDTTNLHAYIRPFGVAAKANNEKSMLQLIQLMATSQHSQSPLGITDNMSALIDEFIANNPIPQSATDNMIEDYKKLSGISPAMKIRLDKLMPAYMPTYIKTGYRYLNDLPPYRALLGYCQTHIVAVSYCRDIAQIMIQKSNSMIDKGMGHSLLIATYELERNQAGIDAAKKLNDQFRQSYECIRDLSSGRYFIDDYFNPKFQEITENAIDEFEMIIQHAELRYQNLKSQGDASAINPNTCFKPET